MKTRVQVKEIKGKCSAGLRVGDVFELEDGFILRNTNGRPICLYALAAHIPYLTTMGRRLMPDDWMNTVSELACPDVKNCVVFSITKHE